ncbi:MAG: hypothetical protein L3J41_15020 [Melioribacteraceae bacterium]|nr:hypothetical protein [Melioribacteraceae bacterium]
MNIFKKLYGKVFLIFLISLLYAIVRYNIFGNVPWEEIPFYITNKAISLTVLFLLLFSVTGKTNDNATKSKFWMIIFILISIHVSISFLLLSPVYFKKFYFENELNLTGYLTLFFGISAFTGIVILNIKKLFPNKKNSLVIPESLIKNIRTLIPFLLMGHLISMGLKGWLSPHNWFGYLIPISLIAFIVLVSYIIKVKRK